MISLAIPTYLEKANITRLLERASSALTATQEEFEIIIVDDDSPDGTAQEVQQLRPTRPWLRLLVRKGERDLSTAVMAGWRIARGDVLGCMDADLQHPPEILVALVERMRATGADLVIASRNVEGGGVSDWALRRRIISWTATLLARLLLAHKIGSVRDPMSGYFLFRREVIAAATLQPMGYKILLEVLARGAYRRAEEVSYVFVERAHGGSKIGPRQTWLYVRHLMRLSCETGGPLRWFKWLSAERTSSRG